MHWAQDGSAAGLDTSWSAPSPRSCDDVIALVAHHNKVPVGLFKHQSRSIMGVARARQVAMYLSHVVLARSLTEIGLAFGRDRTTVSYACGLIEDLRDDPRFDAELCALERQLEARVENGHAR